MTLSPAQHDKTVITHHRSSLPQATCTGCGVPAGGPSTPGLFIPKGEPAVRGSTRPIAHRQIRRGETP